MRSSFFRPAAWAALSGTIASISHADARSGGLATLRPGNPTTPSRTTSSTNAWAKCISDPALTTSRRFGKDFCRYVRRSSIGSTSSRLFIPMMRT
jgi:hypothetical protein